MAYSQNEINPRAGNNRKRIISRISEICSTPQKQEKMKKIKNFTKESNKKMCAQKESPKEKNKIGLLQDYVDTK